MPLGQARGLSGSVITEVKLHHAFPPDSAVLRDTARRMQLYRATALPQLPSGGKLRQQPNSGGFKRKGWGMRGSTAPKQPQTGSSSSVIKAGGKGMCHCWSLNSQVSLSCRFTTQDRAHFGRTFSITASSSHRQEQTLRLPLQTECFAQPSSQQSLLGSRAVSKPVMHQEHRICSRSLPPKQVHSELLPPGPADAERPPQLCSLCCSAWQDQAQTRRTTSVLLGSGRDSVPSYPTLRCNQSSEGGEKLSALPSRAKNFLGCLLFGGWERERAPESGSISHLSPPEGLELWKSSLSPGSPSIQGVSPSAASGAASAPPAAACSEPASPGGAAAGTERTGSMPGWGGEEKAAAAPGRHGPAAAGARRQ